MRGQVGLTWLAGTRTSNQLFLAAVFGYGVTSQSHLPGLVQASAVFPPRRLRLRLEIASRIEPSLIALFVTEDLVCTSALRSAPGAVAAGVVAVAALLLPAEPLYLTCDGPERRLMAECKWVETA
jgi:hypothetical protein